MLYHKSNDYLNYIDGLRAFAVVSVLLFHLNFSSIRGGFVGVDVFFVISGFLITRLIVTEMDQTGRFNFINFYCRRIRRIFPALFFIVFCTWVAGVLLFSPNHLRALGGSMAAAALSLSNVYFWLQSGYFSPASEYKPLLHTWSLGVEEQFYFICPLILFLVVTQLNKKFLPSVIIILGSISLGLNIIFQKNHLNALYFLTPCRCFEFCIGALMVWLINFRPKLHWVVDLICLVGLGMMLYSVVQFSDQTIFPSYNALIPTIGAALVIYAGNARYVGLIFSNRLSVAVGLISYSFYLVHWPIIVFYTYFNSAELTSLVSKCTLMLFSLLMALFTYYFIEQPFRRPISKDKKAQFVLIFKWLPVIGFTSCFGFMLYLSNGWLWRVPDLQGFPLSKEQIAQDYHLTHFGGTGFAYPFGWTYKNENKAPDIVLMGDSHAQMLQYGLLNEIAKPANKSIYMAGSSCLILPDLYRTTIGDDWKTICPNVLNQALKKLHEKEDSILILSEYWLYQIIRAIDVTNNQAWDINLNSIKKSDYQPLLAKLEKLRQLIGNRTLIIIGDVPGAGIKDPFSCLTRPQLAKANCINQIDTSATANVKSLNINKILRNFAKKNKYTYFFDPYAVFCTDKICHSLSSIHEEPYYSDEAHLSKVGSTYLIAKLKPQLMPLILHKRRLDTSILLRGKKPINAIAEIF